MTRFAQRLVNLSLVTAAGLLPLIAGCKEKDSGVDIMTLEGRIEKIDRTSDDTGRVTVVYYSERHGQDMPGAGDVTSETEILINGAAARLADLRVGDRARGEVRVEKKGEPRVQTALKIHVDRPRPVGE